MGSRSSWTVEWLGHLVANSKPATFAISQATINVQRIRELWELSKAGSFSHPSGCCAATAGDSSQQRLPSATLQVQRATADLVSGQFLPDSCLHHQIFHHSQPLPHLRMEAKEKAVQEKGAEFSLWSSSQWLSVPVDIGEKWCPSRVLTGTSTVQ